MCKFVSVFDAEVFFQYVNVTGLACHRQISLAFGILKPQLNRLLFPTRIVYCHMSNLHGILFMWFCLIGTGAYMYSVYLYKCIIISRAR